MITFTPGVRIDHAADALVRLAAVTGEPAIGEFNETPLVAWPHDDLATVLRKYDASRKFLWGSTC